MDRFLTDKDLDILRFVNTYKSITINICAKVFYNYANQAHTLARKELKKLVEMGELKYTQDKRSTQRVFYNTEKPLSSHNLLIYDFLAELVASGANIEMFDTKVTLLDGNLKPDAVILYSYKNGIDKSKTDRVLIFLECVLTNFPNLDKYEVLYTQRKPTNLFNEYEPSIVIVDSRITPIKSKVLCDKIIFLDYKLHGFREKMLPFTE